MGEKEGKQGNDTEERVKQRRRDHSAKPSGKITGQKVVPISPVFLWPVFLDFTKERVPINWEITGAIAAV